MSTDALLLNFKKGKNFVWNFLQKMKTSLNNLVTIIKSSLPEVKQVGGKNMYIGLINDKIFLFLL